MMWILTAVGGFFKKIGVWFWYKATPRTKATIICGLIIVGVVGYIAWLRWTVAELKDDVKEVELQRDLERVEETLREANRQEANFNASVTEANTIRNANFTNTSLNEAEKARCRAYPERCKR